MPRGERPLDDGDSPLLLFAADLRQLRSDAGGPSYRELGRRAHFSASTLSDAAGGRKLPGLDVTLAYVRACGGDDETWERRWHELAAAMAQSRTNEGPSPYVGLKAFTREDADRFFGREALTNTLLDRLDRKPFLAVFGASGEGKSSLLKAGIAPKFGNPVIFSPGEHPDAAIADALGRRPDLLVVDQFEEVFTLCEDPVQRQAFLTALLGADCKTAIAIRSDYYPHCAQHPDLAAALTDAQVLLGTMTTDELRRAITQPAVTAGCTVETALLTTIVAEASGRNGVLPLVSHALQETWYRRRGNTLTLAGYQAAGGIHGALAQSAEAAYSELDEEQQRLARHLLLRLSTDGAKRPVPRTEIVGEEVLNALADARLITVGEHTVEVTHEALFRTWPRLREWLDEDREGLRTHRRLTEAARIWEELGRDSTTLYRTSRLVAVTEWIARGRPELTRTEQDFLDASKHLERRRTHRLRWIAAGLAALLLVTTTTAIAALSQRREIEQLGLLTQSQQLAALSEALVSSNPELAARKAVEAYRASPTAEARGRVLSTATAGRPRKLELSNDLRGLGFGKGFIATGITGGVQLYDATTLRPTTTLVAPSSTSELYSWDVAADGGVIMSETSGRVTYWPAPEAEPVVLLESGRSASVHFNSGGRTAVVGAALWDLDTRRIRAEVPIDWSSRFLAVAGQDGRVLAAVTDWTVVVWDLTTGQRIGEFSAGPSRVSGLRVVHGNKIAVGTADGQVRLWDAATGAVVATLPSHPNQALLNLNADGTVLATSGIAEEQVHLWDVVHGTMLATLNTGLENYGTFFAPDGTLAVIGLSTVRFYPPGSLPTTSAHQVRALSVDEDGTILTLNDAGVIERRDATMRSVSRVETGVGGQTIGRFSPDRRLLVSGATEAPLAVRDVTTGRQVAQLVPGGFADARTPPVSVVFEASRILSAGGDPATAVWPVQDRAVPTVIGSYLDGKHTAITFGGRDDQVVLGTESGQVNVRDTRSWQTAALARKHDGPVRALALSPDKRVLATGGDDGMILLWDTVTWQLLGELRGHSEAITALEFSPDSAKLASGGSDRAVVVWDVGERVAWAKLTGHSRGVTHLAWRKDSTAVVSAAPDTIFAWNLDVDQALRTLD